jgi:hypothetical protein
VHGPVVEEAGAGEQQAQAGVRPGVLGLQLHHALVPVQRLPTVVQHLAHLPKGTQK